MLLKSVQDGGIVSWGNSKQTSNSFATGSFTQDDKSTLRIFNYDSGYKDTTPALVGWSEAPSVFNSLSWDNFGVQDQYPMGVVAGGMQDGSCIFWDVAQLQEQSQTAEYAASQINYHGCISVIDNLFEGPVTTMEFNPFKPNLLAVGGQDVLVMNIEKDISQPQIFSPGSPNLHGEHSITSVSWNRKVQHILASASQNGLTVVWDLKINKSIFSFQDSSAITNRKVSLAWNPEIPTQIAVTYDDERVPELQIWDLRNPQGPVVVFSQAHQQGINCLSWCPSDQSLILTAGRDKQVICWNYKTQQIVRQEQVNFDVTDLKWSNKISGVYACTGQDGHTDIRSLEGTAEGYAPKWVKPPVGARFGPSGSLMTFREQQGTILSQYAPSEKVIDADLDAFDKFIEASHGDLKARIEGELEACAATQGDGEAAFELEQWRLIKALSADDVAEYLNTLGFSKREITAQTENYTGKRHNKKPDEQSQQKAQKNTYDFATLSTQDAENFFDQLTTQSIQKEQKKDGQTQLEQGKEVYTMEQTSRNINWDVGVERIIKDNLIIGNYDGAIDCALKSGRSAEALLMAYSQGKETFESTMSSYLTQQTDFFLKNVVRNLVGRQYEEIAKNYELTHWKECVAIILSAGETKEHSDRFSKIMLQLGDRFLNEKKDERNALLCFILSENLDRCMQLYLKQLEPHNPRTPAYKTKLTKIFKLCIELRDMPGSNAHGDAFKVGLDYMALQLAYIALAIQRPITAYHALSQGEGTSKTIHKIKDLLFNGPHQQHIRKFYDEDTSAVPYKRDIVNAQRMQPPQQLSQAPRSGTSAVIKKNPIFEQQEQQQQPQKQPISRQGVTPFTPQATVGPPSRQQQIPQQKVLPPPANQRQPPPPQQNPNQPQPQQQTQADGYDQRKTQNAPFGGLSSSQSTPHIATQNTPFAGQSAPFAGQQQSAQQQQQQSTPFAGQQTGQSTPFASQQQPPLQSQPSLQKQASNQSLPRPTQQRLIAPPPRATPPPPVLQARPPQQQQQQPPQAAQQPPPTTQLGAQRPQPQPGARSTQAPPPPPKSRQ